MMKKKDKILRDFKKHIAQYPEQYPFTAQFWDINIQDNILKKDNYFVSFGHIGTKSFNSTPFYKPFSRIIDFSKLDD